MNIEETMTIEYIHMHIEYIRESRERKREEKGGRERRRERKGERGIERE